MEGIRSIFRNIHFILHYKVKVEVKLSLQQAVEAHRGVRGRGSHIFYKIGSQMAVSLSVLRAREPFTPQENSWYSYLLEAESGP
jgi:hypothetical protein